MRRNQENVSQSLLEIIADKSDCSQNVSRVNNWCLYYKNYFYYNLLSDVKQNENLITINKERGKDAKRKNKRNRIYTYQLYMLQNN